MENKRKVMCLTKEEEEKKRRITKRSIEAKPLATLVCSSSEVEAMRECGRIFILL